MPIDVGQQVQLKIAKWLRRPSFHRVRLLVDLSWPTTCLTEMLKVVGAARALCLLLLHSHLQDENIFFFCYGCVPHVARGL